MEEQQSINVFKKILIDNWADFKQKYTAYDTDYYNGIIEKVINCGNVKYGYTEYMCINCGQDKVIIPFSCKSKFCLSCGKIFSEETTEEISSKMINGAVYRHMTLTIPEQFRIYFYANRKKGKLLKKFFKAGWECIQDVIKTTTRKDLKCGCVIVLHVSGRKGDYKPHLHIILLDGGLHEETGSWVSLGYFPYEILHKKWQYYLFTMMKDTIKTKEMDSLIKFLWKKYPKGLVAEIKKGDVPERSKGLAKYLTRYISSPTISLRRIKDYNPDKKTVEYVYKSHETKKIETEKTDVFAFIGRMVQQILPKGFQRIRYYGLQATKTFIKYSEILRTVFKKLNKIVTDCYKVIKKSYRDRFKETNQGKDPFICSKCGSEMTLVTVWSKEKGYIYNFFDSSKLKPMKQTKIKVKKEKITDSKLMIQNRQLVFAF